MAADGLGGVVGSGSYGFGDRRTAVTGHKWGIVSYPRPASSRLFSKSARHRRRVLVHDGVSDWLSTKAGREGFMKLSSGHLLGRAGSGLDGNTTGWV